VFGNGQCSCGVSIVKFKRQMENTQIKTRDKIYHGLPQLVAMSTMRAEKIYYSVIATYIHSALILYLYNSLHKKTKRQMRRIRNE
jgi:hypothetical protein